MSDLEKGYGVSRRRKILRGIVSGSGVAGMVASAQWSEPVVRAVTLPAHATTSSVSARALSRFSLTVGSLAVDAAAPGGVHIAERGHSSSPLNLLIPRAWAMSPAYRQMVLEEKPGQRFDFTMLQARIVSSRCIEESLVTARGIPLFTPTPSAMETCLGENATGPEVEVIDVVDDEATIRLDSSESYTLILDPEAQPMEDLFPCPCIED